MNLPFDYKTAYILSTKREKKVKATTYKAKTTDVFCYNAFSIYSWLSC